MASIAKRPDGRWRARYRDNTGKEHSRHFERKVDAQAWLDSVTTTVQTGTYVDPTQSKITVGEWAPKWLATKIDLKPTTKRTYEGLVNNHVLPRWKRVRLVDITHADTAEWVVSLRKSGLSASTVRQTHRVFSLMLTLAVRDGRIARNPADGVPLPRPAKGGQVFLTHDQVDQLADAAGRHRLALLFLAYTGVRYGEMAALRVSNLDLLRRRARIVEAVADVNGHAVLGSPKTHQQRTVPIPKFLAKELEQHLIGKSPGDFVFAAEKGGVLHLRTFRIAAIALVDELDGWIGLDNWLEAERTLGAALGRQVMDSAKPSDTVEQRLAILDPYQRWAQVLSSNLRHFRATGFDADVAASLRETAEGNVRAISERHGWELPPTTMTGVRPLDE